MKAENKRMNREKRRFFHLGLFVAGLLFAGLFSSCTTAGEDGNLTNPGTISVNHTYEDTAILVSADRIEKLLNFQNLETGKRYTLSYDGITSFADKYGTAMSAEQLVTGSIADITFIKESKYLKDLKLSSEYFSLSKVAFEELYKKDTRMTLLGEEYKLDDYLVIASESETIDRMELHEGDMLTIYGKDHTIYSMHLEQGHGYLRLENADYFIGGWIEVGNKVIQKVTENMLLTVPEGTYEVLVSNDGVTGVKNATIGRNQEVSIDLGDIEFEKKMGSVLFVLQPSDATLYVDGAKVNTGGPVSLEYGIHQLICRAADYETMSSYIKVGSPYASVTLTLTKEDAEDSSEKDSEKSSEDSSDKKDEDSSESSTERSTEDSSEKSTEDSTESSSEKSTEDSSESSSEKDDEDSSSENSSEDDSEEEPEVEVTEGAKVYIDAPEGVDVSLDGEYVGVTPTFFAKKEGTLVVTLRKTGYQTRSYTLRLEDDDAEIHYSFSALVKSS